MNVLEEASAALELIRTGRQTLSRIVDAVRDGQVALATTDVGKLNAMLAQEKTETQAAHNALDRAIQIAGSK